MIYLYSIQLRSYFKKKSLITLLMYVFKNAVLNIGTVLVILLLVFRFCLESQFRAPCHMQVAPLRANPSSSRKKCCRRLYIYDGATVVPENWEKYGSINLMSFRTFRLFENLEAVSSLGDNLFSDLAGKMPMIDLRDKPRGFRMPCVISDAVTMKLIPLLPVTYRGG